MVITKVFLTMNLKYFHKFFNKYHEFKVQQKMRLQSPLASYFTMGLNFKDFFHSKQLHFNRNKRLKIRTL